MLLTVHTLVYIALIICGWRYSQVYNGSTEEPYTNPGAPVHIVTGSAGCQEGREPFPAKIPAWSAFHSRDYGYTRMKAHNTTHLHFEQISVDKIGAPIDAFWIVKDKHEAYTTRPHAATDEL